MSSIFAAENVTFTNKIGTLIYIEYENKDKNNIIVALDRDEKKIVSDVSTNSQKIGLYIGSIINSKKEVFLGNGLKNLILQKTFCTKNFLSDVAVNILQDGQIIASVDI